MVKHKNVGPAERWGSLLLGAVPLLSGVRRLRGEGRISFGAVIWTLIGAYLVERGATGRCAIYRTLGIDHGRVALEPPSHVETRSDEAPSSASPVDAPAHVLTSPMDMDDGNDMIDEASWESFPASDPPARRT